MVPKKGVKSELAQMREDRNILKKTTFDPVILEGREVKTAILLLQSDEQDVVTRALASLDRFASKSPENVLMFLDVDLQDVLLPLVQDGELFVRRFSCKIIAQMCPLLAVKHEFVLDNVTKFADILTTDVDTPMQEYSSAVLAKLTKVSTVCAKLIDTDVMEILFVRLSCADPDIQYNCCQIMENLLRDPEAATRFVNCQSFQFKTILALLPSFYPLIQYAALEILNLLTKRVKDKTIQDLFRQSKAVDELVSILEMFDWMDLHHGILSIISNVTDYTPTAEYIGASGILRRLLLYMKNIDNRQLKEGVWKVIAKAAKRDLCRKILYENHIVGKMVACLRNSESPELTKAVCTGISFMLKDERVVEALKNEYTIRDLLSIMKSDLRPWDTRQAAAKAVAKMLEVDEYYRELFLAYHSQDIVVVQLTYLENVAPVEMLKKLLNCLLVLSAYPEARNLVASAELAEAIMPHLKAESLELRLMACECLNAYACEESVRKQFQQKDGVLHLTNCITYPNAQLQEVAASSLQLYVTDETTASVLIKNGTLDWMIKQEGLRKECPSWEAAIEAVLRRCLPAKFAYTGHLDVQDVTTNAFYIFRNVKAKFRMLDDILMNQSEDGDLVYIVNFNTHTLEEKPVKPETAPAHKRREPAKRAQRYKSHHPSVSIQLLNDESQSQSLSTILDNVFDHNLIIYLRDVKRIEKELHGEKTKVVTRAEDLGKYVGQQMCGTTRFFNCTDDAYQRHIIQLKKHLASSVIPIGLIRIGMKFERAVLYKMLADRIGLPCALVRGEYGSTWNEVTLPQVDPKLVVKKGAGKNVPTHVLKPNYVVDLMEEPGRLLHVGSKEAAKYCRLPSTWEKLPQG